MEIAIVGRHRALVDRARASVEALGHQPTVFSTPQALRSAAECRRIGMVVFVMGAEQASPSACVDAVRAADRDAPVLVAVSPSNVALMGPAFESPLSEFIVRPYTSKELRARVHAVLRRTYRTCPENQAVFGPYRFLPLESTVELHGVPIKLNPKMFALATFFFNRPGQLFSRDHLRAAVWPTAGDGQSRTVDTHLSVLRNRLQLEPANGYVLRNVYRRGYLLDAVHARPVEVADPPRFVPSRRDGVGAHHVADVMCP
ncbi:response regulator transcription factor [Variovorax sp. PBL-E5]|uniref:response regulator transcription factor n=1 Tax=Variovorax sp. PBL-E5 TaxID=434014 RepID=UPI001316C320|nr:winged helix-turn-helix domain-containing protein [Variovorax sp. PBL-E5]VTU16403.1 Alkaline phosphatase synthesis transcriptional regulatory protein PhoP [Variovorax sp. PBL-E5]